MPDRSRKRPRDVNSLAASIVRDATDEDKTAPADVAALGLAQLLCARHAACGSPNRDFAHQHSQCK